MSLRSQLQPIPTISVVVDFVQPKLYLPIYVSSVNSVPTSVAELCVIFLLSFPDQLLFTALRELPFSFFGLSLECLDSLCHDAMADGQAAVAVEVATADPTAFAADFVPLDDSDSPVNAHDGDDSASDVPMTTETDDEDDMDDSSSLRPQAAQPNAIVGTPYNIAQNPDEDLPRKRKSPDDVSDNDDGRNALESVKKVKLADSMEEHQGDGNSSSDRSRLPAEVWQYIFTFCPPRTLGRLLRVSRLFNLCLDPSSTVEGEQPASLPRTAVAALKPNSIWQFSRRRFWPSMPSPIQDKTELYMWQLSCSSSCQHCGSSMSQQEDLIDPWQSGPGKDGVAIIWPFATRSCGLCLLSKSTKVCCAKQERKNCMLNLTRC